MKIRTRLTLQFILLTAGIFTATLLFIYKQFRQHVENEFFSLLESKALMTAEMVLRHEETLQPLMPGDRPGSSLPGAGNTSIYNEAFQRVFVLNPSSGQTSPSQLSMIWRDGKCRFQSERFYAFGAVIRAESGRDYVVVSEDRPDYSKLTELRNILVLGFFIAMAAIAAGGWFYAGQALAPVSRIVKEVDDILPADLSRRLRNDDQRDELAHLVATFNRLLDRIERAFQMQRSFISNVSHELKNPLAAMDAQLQLARSKPRTAEAYSEVLHSLHDDVREMEDTAEKLLQLAKVHSEANAVRFEKVRLDELLYQTRDQLLKSHPTYTVRIEISRLPENEDKLCTSGNEPLLRTALLNLFDNACKFSPDHTVRIAMGCDEATGQVQVDIRNEGEGIPQQDLPHIFEPFFRSAQHARKRGSGVGLSLVQSILQLHRIEAQVFSEPNKGAHFSLRFPSAQTARAPLAELPVSPPEQEKKMSIFTGFRKASLWCLAAVLLFQTHCSSPVAEDSPTNQAAFEVLQDWNRMLLDLNRHTEGYRPPVSARMYAYMGMAAWESARPALPQLRSLLHYWNIEGLPEPAEANQLIPGPALSASYAAMAQYFFPHTQPDLKEECRRLLEKHVAEAREKAPEAQVAASVSYGKAVAAAVFRWSARDSIGHQAYWFNYDRNYTPPQGPGLWTPSSDDPMPALLPHWGGARLLCVQADGFQFRPPVSFSEQEHSPFFAQAMEVYSISRPLTPEKRWIAEFWSDDYPGVSFCPVSRWISITMQALDKKRPDLMRALETYLSLGIALNDAAVLCWRGKYQYNLERPESYISRLIQPGWGALHPTPPFPAYPSGHASFGAAACAILEHMLGRHFEMTDRSHEHRTEFKGAPRSYASFREMALENALSRLFMGVHFRMDSEEGLRLGEWVGGQVLQMDWRQDKEAAIRR